MITAGDIRKLVQTVALALLCGSGLPALALDEPARPAGLMWNRTGLPAVFPLQVRSAAGADYFMILTDTATGDPALAAYIRGGDFFRVLVPPGTFTLSFASGQKWRGEEALFGPASRTRHFELEEPLTFAVRDRGTRAGHLIDISSIAEDQTAEIDVRSQLDCRSRRMGAGDLLQRPASEALVTPREGRFLWDERRRAAEAGQPFLWHAPGDSAGDDAGFSIFVEPVPQTRKHPC